MPTFSEFLGIVSIIGPSEADEELYRVAEELGFELAKNKILVVCGGRSGIMEAVCRGVDRAGGISVGILPGNIEEANPYVTVPIATYLGEARNAIVAVAGQIVVAIGGGVGTLSEIALALKSGRLVIGLKTWKAVDAYGHVLPILFVENINECIELIIKNLKILNQNKNFGRRRFRESTKPPCP